MLEGLQSLIFKLSSSKTPEIQEAQKIIRYCLENPNTELLLTTITLFTQTNNKFVLIYFEKLLDKV
jgi:hypothetical protein